jgi:hypothetical protein
MEEASQSDVVVECLKGRGRSSCDDLSGKRSCQDPGIEQCCVNRCSSRANAGSNTETTLSFQSGTGTTENEFELSPKTRGTDHKGQGKRRVGSVGGFSLDREPSFASSACSLIEGQFPLSSTECTCTLSSLHSSAVKFGCEQSEVMCNKDKDRSEKKVCARLVHTGTVSLENPVLSSDVCLKDLRIQGKKRGDLCLSLEYEKRDALKKCRARIGDRNCQCNVCDDGMGVRLDCSSVDPSLVSPHCDEISVITSVLGEASSIQHYLPTFPK